MIEILDPGLMTTIQDGGRRGYRSLGVAVSGAIDPVWLACANALAGNAPDIAGLELHGLRPRLRAVGGPASVAFAGPVTPHLDNPEGSTYALGSWRSLMLCEGETLRVGAVAGALAYLAVAGGIAVPPQLGSRATHVRSGIGGIAGRALQAGDLLPTGERPRTAGAKRMGTHPFIHDGGPIRVLWGPQDDHFTVQAREDFIGSPFEVTRDVDRMGIRLRGPRLAHVPDKGADIISDAVTPGAIQVPADGQPIVLLADCQTVGGYAKIATVISADLPRLAHLMPGDKVRFARVNRAEAAAALRRRTDRLAAWIAGIVPWRPVGSIDEAALRSENLIGGMVDAFAEPAS